MGILDGIKSTMFNLPSNYNEARDRYTFDLQEKINDTYWLSSDTYEIMEEITPGKLDFEPLVCRVNHAIEPKTGLNRGDDYKELRFFDMSKDYPMGKRFMFNNSVWITVNTDQYHYITKSSIIRRCNNVLKFRYMGKVVEEPCIVDYSLKYSNVYYNNLVDLANGSRIIVCQFNDITKSIEYNDRFIIGKVVYKIKSIDSGLRQETYTKNSVPLIEFTAYVDTDAYDDDFENDLAWSEQENPNENIKPVPSEGYDINICPDIYNILLNEEIAYNIKVYKDGTEVQEELEIVPAPVLENYIFTKISNNSFSIKNISPYYESPITIKCFNENIEKTYEFNLRGLY